MKQIPLGRAGFTVSEWCLGTMTFAGQTPEADAHRQIEMSLDAGIDFLDTAEMYPVNPVRPETAGNSETVIGNWIEKTGRGAEIKVATKAVGPNGMGLRENGKGYTTENLRGAVEDSLRRLRRDVIDLYQLHWPVRGSYMFRQNWTYDPAGQSRQETLDHMDSILGVLKDLVAEGKIRAFGMSNETCWGTTRWIDRAEATGGPRLVSVQNEYSLMCRLYDTDMAEMAVNEDVLLLSFSPLAAGILTGKYLDGTVPEGSRRSLVPEMGGRVTARSEGTARAYVDLAERHGLSPVHMAMAWQTTRPFPVCPIFGATNVTQLEHILEGKDVTLSDEVLSDIVETHKAHPMPY
ncbi:aldo/keto reductase [Ponticoccus sp. SC2-23]|uniref:aldo/keto reductase n=1 Tax=Alexandriicola marinus TaxID=2081710 RepID=UPI000FD75F3E|nr:aldo/keto reductase [Alexandriicola marinus]MBM1221199.1 aldo/keto reductase [Ponticoccus sp. SC6-9]MBM1225769.1 aldo/keto reductase [Ponticoccus sp. SC6-15]MBM1227921.1 aldo/keto reductase [Ponticoccus sp. SC6-38]MBM1234441.1 aldo/keto reductase [Ponticoccus sp. SC6-45]MBM1238423.1 aldo/keto reductase [Ponticoccus sp. SC6-49]MBM1243692.1 aldo/keto reductase [Ponticoccus sp. SC2-64]MBM1247965.1 aldo/keto reductase [Ponticoccus sp. SC6-42]MBM1252823.1 aldo/keto reductase [Ponticoccus sp. 